MHACKKGLELGSVHPWSGGMKGVFARCNKKTAVQVCTLTIMHYCPVTVNINAMIAYPSFLYWQPNLAALCVLNITLMGVYFRRLKKTMTSMSLYLILAQS